jgi:hypothetical protein
MQTQQLAQFSIGKEVFKSMRQGTKKAWKYLVLSVCLVIAILIFLKMALRYRPFEGIIEAVRFESYAAPDRMGILLPAMTEVPYEVKRINVRTRKGEILDLGLYGSDLDPKAVGRLIKGSYRPGKTLSIVGKKVIFGLFDYPGPKIELRGNPDGVIRTYEVASAQVR